MKYSAWNHFGDHNKNEVPEVCEHLIAHNGVFFSSPEPLVTR